MPTLRTDRVSLRLDESSVVAHPNGWLDCSGRATRVGVFDYEAHRELRPVSEVMHPDSLASLRGVPVTVEHPAGVLDAGTTKAATEGVVLDVWPDGEFVGVRVRLYTEQGIAAAKEYRELSCGYTADVVDEAGTYDGEPYDKTQRTIRYNHLSIVPQGRAGPHARLLLDSQGHPMKPLKIDATKSPRHAATARIAQALAAKTERTDEAQVRRVVIALESGEELELMLPGGMVDQLLAMLGVGSEGEAPEAEEVDVEVPDEDPMASEEPAADMEGEAKIEDDRGAAVEGGGPNGATYDAATVEAKIKRAVADAIAAERERVAAVEMARKLDATIKADATTHDALCAAAIATGMDEAHARSLRKRADALAATELRTWVSAVTTGRRDSVISITQPPKSAVAKDPIAAVSEARSLLMSSTRR
jgi:uncharacterized protein